MQLVFQRIREAAGTQVTVLIMGESGTGKELVAESIHRRSTRRNAAFVAVNTGAISRELVASELFGHQKGSFTGATDTKPGKFEQANGGTLFLDEISTMDEATQVSLLRVLETRTLQRIGGRRNIKLDVRIIAASNEEIHTGSEYIMPLRQDLFHRLSVFTITLPPLRERGEDIDILALELLDQACEKFERNIKGFTSRAARAIKSYAWPGNVREMKNVIERAVLICKKNEIDIEHLPKRLYSFERLFQDIIIPHGSTLQEAEKIIIIRTLAANNGNRKKTAEILGISRRTLYNKLDFFQLI